MVHLTEHVQLLLIAPEALHEAIPDLGDAPGERRQVRRPFVHREALVAQRAADRGHDLVDGVRPRIGDPVAPTSGPRRQLGSDHTVDEVVDVHHRATLLTVADNGEPAGPDETEERRLPQRLERTVEPRWPHDRGIEPVRDRVENSELAFHLRPPVVEVRVVRLVASKGVARLCIRAERAVRRHVHQAPHPMVERRLGDVASAVDIDLQELARSLRMDDPDGVDDVDVGAGSVEQARRGVGLGDVADHDVDPVECLEPVSFRC